MKHILLSAAILLSVFTTTAQNYQCLQPGVKRYFMNDNRYLRGIRIDSVKTYSDSVVYFAYHTPRGRYATNPNLDSTGGSWLGKKVVQLNDGTFLFDNIWGDTVVIKTQAHFGDSWIFYNDTSSLYYQAYLSEIDTATILGVVDSIKRIVVTARNPLGLVTSDPADSFEIVLSMNHGFVKVFDLHTFPYHDPGAAFHTGLDFYLDNLMVPTGPFLPNRANSIFSLIALNNITYAQLYQWNTGDIYEYSACNNLIEHSDAMCVPPENYTIDTITAAAVTTSSSDYNFKGAAYTIAYFSTIPITPGYYVYNSTKTTGSLNFDATPFIDTVLMPEEFKQQYIYSYVPGDTSYCMNGTLYSATKNIRIANATFHGFFENYVLPTYYKAPLGLLKSFNSGVGTNGYYVGAQELTYYNRSGTSCGLFVTPPTRVIDPATMPRISFSPNPAASELTIKTNISQPYTIALFNVVGQTMQVIKSVAQSQTIDVSTYPAGVYSISIVTEDGGLWNDKVVIMH